MSAGSIDSRFEELGTESNHMTWDIIEGQWNAIKGRLRSRWRKLTNDDLAVIAGQRDVLVGRIQQRYGLKRVDAELEVEGWLAHI